VRKSVRYYVDSYAYMVLVQIERCVFMQYLVHKKTFLHEYTFI